MNIPHLLQKSLTTVENFILAGLLCSIIALSCLQISMRLFFHSGFIWLDPLLRHMVLWVGLFGALAATAQGKHLAIDLLQHLLAPCWQRRVAIVIDCITAAICAVLTWSAVLFLKSEIAFSSPSLFGLPSWQFGVVFPVVFACMTLRFMVQAGKKLGTANRRENIRKIPSLP